MTIKSRPEILVIAKTAPLHDRASGDYRLYELLRMLATENNVHYLTTWHTVLHKFKERPVSYVVRDGIFSQKNLEFLDGKYFDDLRSIGVNPVNQPLPVPFTVRPTNDFDIRPFLLAKRYDVIWIEFFYLADQYIDLIRQLQPWAHVIVDSVDLHFHRLERQCTYLETQVKYSVNAEQEKRPLDSAFQLEIQNHRNYAAHVKEHELRAYSKCDRVVTVSETDTRELLAHLPHIKTMFAPNIHRVPSATSSVRPREKRSGVIFVGNFDHGPNSSSAIFLKHEIAPALAAVMKPVPFYIVGSNPPYLIRNMEKYGPCADQFKVTGYVPDTRRYLDKACVSVAPILFGAGMNGKIGEAMAAGVPVVTTHLGASGMNLKHEETCLIAETAEEFASAIRRLHEDEALWNRISENSRAFLERNLGQETIAPEILASFREGFDLEEIRRLQKVDSRRRQSLPRVSLSAPRFPVVKNPELSVIVLCYNQWAYTELCLRSLSHAHRLSPKMKVEYILVDNASTDETLHEAAKIPGLRVVANRKNLGFAAGNNSGILAARGSRAVVLLNNDTIVPPHWLERLDSHANRIERLGILGPCSNTEPGQALFGARYNGLREFFDFNKEIGSKNIHQWELCEKISGLCMYLPRKVIAEVGLLSEDYGIGYFEDDDYCFRVRDAGFRTVWAKDTYVHHFGSVSFEHSSASREKHLNYGMSQFIFKWGKRALKHIAQSHRQTLIKPASLSAPPEASSTELHS